MFGFRKNNVNLVPAQKVKGQGFRRLIPVAMFFLKSVCFLVALAAILSALVGTFVLTRSFHYFVAKSGYFELAQLEISPEISDEVREEIIELTGMKVHNGVNLLRLNADRARQAIMTHPKMRWVTVAKTYPRRVTVQGREREPVAIVCASGFFLIDEEANVLGVADNRALAAGFPFITGTPAEGVTPGKRINAPYIFDALDTLMALRRVDSDLLGMLSEIQLDAIKGVTLYLKGGMEMRLGTETAARKLPLASFFVRQHPDTRQYEYLDLRFDNQMVFKARERSAE